MGQSGPTLRLFVALYPSSETVAAVESALASVSLPPNRPTPREQIHMTLQFIGPTARCDLDDAIESVERATAGLGGFSLQPQRLVTFPERGPTRLVAVETDAPPILLELHSRLAIRLAQKVRRKPSDRFRPHMTLCRFRAPAHGYSLDEPVAVPACAVDRIFLMKSTLRPSGAVHEEVATYLLDK